MWLTSRINGEIVQNTGLTMFILIKCSNYLKINPLWFLLVACPKHILSCGHIFKCFSCVFQMLTAMTETPAAVLFGLGPVLKCFFIFPATESWCSFSGRPSSCRETEQNNTSERKSEIKELQGVSDLYWPVNVEEFTKKFVMKYGSVIVSVNISKVFVRWTSYYVMNQPLSCLPNTFLSNFRQC